MNGNPGEALQLERAEPNKQELSKTPMPIFLALYTIKQGIKSLAGLSSLKEVQTKQLGEFVPISDTIEIQADVFALLVEMVDPDLISPLGDYANTEEGQQQKANEKFQSLLELMKMVRDNKYENHANGYKENFGKALVNTAYILAQVFYYPECWAELFAQDLFGQEYVKQIEWFRKAIQRHPILATKVLINKFAKIHFPEQSPTYFQVLAKLEEIYPYLFKDKPFEAEYKDENKLRNSPPNPYPRKQGSMLIYVTPRGQRTEAKTYRSVSEKSTSQVTNPVSRNLSQNSSLEKEADTELPQPTTNSIELNLDPQITTPRGATLEDLANQETKAEKPSPEEKPPFLPISSDELVGLILGQKPITIDPATNLEEGINSKQLPPPTELEKKEIDKGLQNLLKILRVDELGETEFALGFKKYMEISFGLLKSNKIDLKDVENLRDSFQVYVKKAEKQAASLKLFGENNIIKKLTSIDWIQNLIDTAGCKTYLKEGLKANEKLKTAWEQSNKSKAKENLLKEEDKIKIDTRVYLQTVTLEFVRCYIIIIHKDEKKIFKEIQLQVEKFALDKKPGFGKPIFKNPEKKKK